MRAVEDQKDDPLKLLVVRCATCGHVLVDKTRRITPAMVAAARQQCPRCLGRGLWVRFFVVWRRSDGDLAAQWSEDCCGDVSRP